MILGKDYTLFLQQKLFLVEQQATRHLKCDNIEEMKRTMKEIQNICFASAEFVQKKMESVHE